MCNLFKIELISILKKLIKSWIMAEREGFEPSKRFPVYTLSKRAPSTTRPPLLENSYTLIQQKCSIRIYNSIKENNAAFTRV